MKTKRSFLIPLLLFSLFILSNCDSNDYKETSNENRIIITYVFANNAREDYVEIIEEGNYTYGIPHYMSIENYTELYEYSFSPDFEIIFELENFEINGTTYYTLGRKFNENTTIYVRMYGGIKKLSFYVDSNEIYTSSVSYNEKIYKLPEINNSGFLVTDYGIETFETSFTGGDLDLDIDEYFVGYNFSGWYYDEELTQPVLLPVSIEENDINFYSSKTTPKIYTVNIEYYFENDWSNYITTDNIIFKTSVQAPFESDLKTLIDFKDEYYEIGQGANDIVITASNPSGSSYLGGWNGACNHTIYVRVNSIYDGYILVTSDINTLIDNKLIPSSVLTSSSDYLNLVNTFGSNELVAIKKSEIKTIIFMPTLSLPETNLFLDSDYGFPNLEMVDISKLSFISSIPDNFFNFSVKLTEIKSNSLPKLKEIGDNFLYQTNIIHFNIDLSCVETIGVGFLRNAFSGIEYREITIDLPNLKNISPISGYFLYHEEWNNNSIITLIIYDFVLDPSYFYPSLSWMDNVNPNVVRCSMYTDNYEAIKELYDSYEFRVSNSQGDKISSSSIDFVEIIKN